MAHDLLIEIGCEELPPKDLLTLAEHLHNGITAALQSQALNFTTSRSFATPRRLAVIVQQLDEQQADREEEKLGPAVAAAFDKEGKPSKAAEGFARSNNTTVEQLAKVDTDKGERLAFRHTIKGRAAGELIPAMLEQALAALPIAKRMRWGESRAEFVRPVKWLVMMLDDQVVDASILGKQASNTSHGHRFHSPQAIEVNAATYEQQLHAHYVIADFSKRRELILEQIRTEAAALNGQLGENIDDLLNEVTALVEWPVALAGQFDQSFLQVPAEALISSMVEHQKYFHVLDKQGNLMPHFITVANIESTHPPHVIHGNERVIRPRLTDAAFFFETDKQTSLELRCEQLKSIVFQQKLGSLYDKSQRISKLAAEIAGQTGGDVTHAERAGLLAKADLVSEMVLEFADLQGLMGYHYALHDGEPEAVAEAIRDHYYPAGNNNRMPVNKPGLALALADRIDTLVGIFGIGQKPTGNKDPFALRRTALGIIRILLHADADLDLLSLYNFAAGQFAGLAADTVADALAYTMERFRAINHEKGYATEVYLAVAAKHISRPLDFARRSEAVHRFSQLPEAEALAAANKRVGNILAKQTLPQGLDVNTVLLQENAEKTLFTAMQALQSPLDQAASEGAYTKTLSLLAELKAPIDAFFDQVMVMVDNPDLQNNRLALLQQLHARFMQVADIALLAGK